MIENEMRVEKLVNKIVQLKAQLKQARKKCPTFKSARKRMGLGLLDPGLYDSYKANIAMCIYDNRRKDGRLNHKECNDVAEKMIALIWDVKIKKE